MAESLNPDVRIFKNLESLSRAAAAALVEVVAGGPTGPGIFTVALAGGNTPRTLYHLLAEEFRDDVPWKKVHVFWGDERCVPFDHPDSNYNMALRMFLSRVPIPGANIHRVPVDVGDPARASAAYNGLLGEFFGTGSSGGGFPVFDLVLLGVGRDSHTASLFPGDPALDEEKRPAVHVRAPAGVSPRDRITLTLPVINGARYIYLLVHGMEKRKVVRTILDDTGAARSLYPAARVKPKGSLTWWLDRAAAGMPALVTAFFAVLQVCV